MKPHTYTIRETDTLDWRGVPMQSYSIIQDGIKCVGEGTSRKECEQWIQDRMRREGQIASADRETIRYLIRFNSEGYCFELSRYHPDSEKWEWVRNFVTEMEARNYMEYLIERVPAQAPRDTGGPLFHPSVKRDPKTGGYYCDDGQEGW